MEVQSLSVSAAKPAGRLASPIVRALWDLEKAGVIDPKIKLNGSRWLEENVALLKAVGAAGAAVLSARQIFTVRDLVELPDVRLVGIEPNVAKAAYAAKKQVTAALEKHGIKVEHRPDTTFHTQAIRLDPVTGISYSS